jgi:hypothetical protein
MLVVFFHAKSFKNFRVKMIFSCDFLRKTVCRNRFLLFPQENCRYEFLCTTGIDSFAECLKHSAKP